MKDSRSLTFQLPPLVRALSPNSRSRWATIEAKKKARAAAMAEALRVLADAGTPPPRWVKATYIARNYNTKNCFPDEDNFIASLKAYIDGLEEAGIVANDKGLKIRGTENHVVARMPRVEITITPEN